MKRYIPFLLACLLGLTGCGRNDVDPELVITCAPTEETIIFTAQPTQTQQSQTSGLEKVAFTVNGVELLPGASFDPSLLPQAESLYEVPSCAIEGTDNLYNYGTFELTAFDDGVGEVIYSIVLLDPNITTNEGLALGDDEAMVTSIYGDNYTQEGTARVYSTGNGMLYVFLQRGSVVSIEYRMIVDA